MTRPIFDGYYLPLALTAGIETSIQRFGPAHDAIQIRLPTVMPSDVTRWIVSLRRARAEHLVDRPIASILRPLERVVTRYLDRKNRARRALVQALEGGRLSSPMAERALDDAFEPLARGGLRKWVVSELGAVSTLDRPMPTREGVLRRAVGPEWMFQVYAGNVPSVPIWPIFSALLLKSALLAKTSAQEPLLAPLLARAIADEDEDLGECLAVVWWKGGTAELERAALAEAPAVLAFGGDAAIGTIARQARPGARLVLHGPKVSLAYVGRGSLTRGSLRSITSRLAQDVSMFDQQGCLSPHAVYVERGAAVTAVDFAAALGEALEAASLSLPREEPSAGQAASVQLYRAQARFESSVEAGRIILTSPAATVWTVVCESGARFEPSPTHRVVRVHSVTGPEEFETAIRPSIRHIEALAVEETGTRRARLASRFSQLGIPRIAAIGSLQRPMPWSTHGGVHRLLPFVIWSTVDGTKRVRAKRAVAKRVRAKRAAPKRTSPRRAAKKGPRRSSKAKSRIAAKGIRRSR